MISPNNVGIPRYVCKQPGSQVTPEQWRMARAALKLGMRELAKLAGTSSNSLVNIEKGKYVHHSITNKIRTHLECRGVEFIDSDSVRLRQCSNK